MNHINPDNDWEDDYYSRKHRSRTVTAAYAFYLAVICIVFFLLFSLFGCNRTAYTQTPQPERIPVYNCGE